MKPELHPDAARNFNDKARALLDKVAPMTEALPSELPTHIARPGAPAHVVSEGKLFEFKITGLQDQFGRTTARYFEHQGRRFGLEGDRYKELAQVSEGLQKTNQLREVVSNKWVEDRILDWMKEQHAGAGAPETVRTFMLDAWRLFIALVKASHKFDTKTDFINHLDAMRLS
jgi:hypothetical protein